MTKVVYPVNGTAVKTATITILGVTSTPAEGVSLSLNGREIPISVDSEGVFALSLRLRKWWNVLHIDGRQIKVFFAYGGRAPPENAQEGYPHPAAMEGCTDCHEFDGKGGVELAEKGKELCLMCHDDPTLDKTGEQKTMIHSPIADDDDCTLCHDPHQGENRTLNVEPQPDLCYQCHDNVAEEGKGEQNTHAPVLEGECTQCHDPHASDYGKLLPETGPDVCYECHDDVTRTRRGRPMTVVHSPIAADDDCASCHDPHQGENKALNVEPLPELCYQCHDSVTEKKNGKEFSQLHGPVSGGYCTQCHNPHAAGNKALLPQRGTRLCFECHDDPSLDTWGNAWIFNHEPVREDCTNCHSPHASDFGNNLTDEIFELCSGCHDEHPRHSLDASAYIEVEGSGIVSLPGDFPTTFDGMMICTGCHQPHGSNNAMLLVKPKGELCGMCH